MSEPKTIKINNVEYVRKDDVQEKIEWTGKESIASRMIGKKVIVRSRNEGINAGIVVLADDHGIELKDARRLWYHKPKDKSLSWYEGVAVSGLSDDSRVSGIVETKVIIEDYSVTICSEEAFKSIMDAKTNASQ